MDRLDRYRQIVRRVIEEYASYKPSNGQIDTEAIADPEHDHYEVMHVGWDGERRVHGSVIHIDIIDGKVDLVINSPRGRGARADGEHIRNAAGVNQVPCLTTAAAGLAAAEGIADWAHHELRVRSLQEYHQGRDADMPELPL